MAHGHPSDPRDTSTQDERINHEEFTPELVNPFHKAPPRKDLRRGRKKRKSTTYTRGALALVRKKKSKQNMKKNREKSEHKGM